MMVKSKEECLSAGDFFLGEPAAVSWEKPAAQFSPKPSSLRERRGIRETAQLVPLKKKLHLVSPKIFFLLLTFLVTSTTHALPIGFGIHQGDLEYRKNESKNFYLYHDARTPHEGAMTLNSLEAMKPVLENWFGIERTKKMPVISSAVTAGASFANFLTDAIELQTMGDGDRDLFWHEFTHMMMYEHLHDWFGPAGSLLHLPWMPAWFIEGLAESLSVSVRSDIQAGFERYHALTGLWPTFDQLHSLYGGSDFSTEGYATSGSFVSWILRSHDKHFPTLLKDFDRYTYPQYFLWSFNPFSSFLPMDEALKNFTGQGARALYESYKQKAKAYWLKHRLGPFFGEIPGKKLSFNYIGFLHSDGSNISLSSSFEGKTAPVILNFNKDSGWGEHFTTTEIFLPSHVDLNYYIMNRELQIFVQYFKNPKSGLISQKIVYQTADGSLVPFVELAGDVVGLFETSDKVVWLEKDPEISRLCWVLKNEITSQGKKECPVEYTLPRSLNYLGMTQNYSDAESSSPVTQKIWFALKEQTLVGDRFELLILDFSGKELQKTQFKLKEGGIPLSFAEAGSEKWLLVGEHNRHSLRRLDLAQKCVAQIDFEDIGNQLVGTKDGSLILTLQHGLDYRALKINPARLRQKRCSFAEGHKSPYTIAMANQAKISMYDALQRASLWSSRDKEDPLKTAIENQALPLDQAPPPQGGLAVSPQSAGSQGWQPRFVMMFPWIGGDDPLGYQFGVVTLPLMDHMQNETVQGTVLYSFASGNPSFDLGLTSTRFWPTLSASVYKSSVWDGIYNLRKDGKIVGSFSSYIDETGFKTEASYTWYFWNSTLSAAIGSKFSQRDRYPKFSERIPVIQGHMVRPYGSLSYSTTFKKLSLSSSLSASAAPAFLNKNYDFNQIMIDTSLGYALPRNSRLSLGVASSWTSGDKEKMPHLREYYIPLKTFVPGSGGGLNQNSINILGQGSLFYPRYGDTTFRFKSDFTVPLVRSINRLIWILYFNRIDFSAFFNYGGAWERSFQKFKDRAIAAHGYNIDLLLENKGINFNAGIGAGQVIRDKWQAYVTFGFDALF